MNEAASNWPFAGARYLKRWPSYLLLFWLAAAPRGAAGQRERAAREEGAGPLDVEAAVAEALAVNPEILAARQAAAAAEERIRPAGALADPALELSVEDLGMDSGSRRSELMLRQMVDSPGKRGLMRQEMRDMAGMSVQETAELELALEAQVHEAYWDLHLVHENLDLAEKTLRILQDFAQIAETRYAVGTGIQPDVLRAQAEVYKLQARLLEFRQDESVRRSQLNVLLGREPGRKLEIVLPRHSLPELPGDPDELAEEALGARPMLRGMALDVDRQGAREALAKKELWPNLELQASVMRVGAGEVPVGMDESTREIMMAEMPSDTAFSVGIMASIPLWKGSKQQRRITAARHEREASLARMEAARLAVGLQVQTLVQEAARIRAQIQLYDAEVLPRAQQAASSSLESYQTGQVDFLTLLSSQITVLDSQFEQHRLQAAYHKTLARLAQARGRNGTPGERGRAARAAASDTSGLQPEILTEKRP